MFEESPDFVISHVFSHLKQYVEYYKLWCPLNYSKYKQLNSKEWASVILRNIELSGKSWYGVDCIRIRKQIEIIFTLLNINGQLPFRRYCTFKLKVLYKTRQLTLSDKSCVVYDGTNISLQQVHGAASMHL